MPGVFGFLKGLNKAIGPGLGRSAAAGAVLGGVYGAATSDGSMIGGALGGAALGAMGFMGKRHMWQPGKAAWNTARAGGAGVMDAAGAAAQGIGRRMNRLGRAATMISNRGVNPIAGRAGVSQASKAAASAAPPVIVGIPNQSWQDWLRQSPSYLQKTPINPRTSLAELGLSNPRPVGEKVPPRRGPRYRMFAADLIGIGK